jgi:hypothetical protein
MANTTSLAGIIKASGKKTGQNSSSANAKMAEKTDPKKNISKGQTGASAKVAEGKPVQKNVNTTNLSGIAKASGTQSATGKKTAAVAKEVLPQNKQAAPKPVIPLSTFGSQTKPVAKPVNTNTIEGIRDASKTGSSGIKSSGKTGQNSSQANLRMAESKKVGLGGQSSSKTNLRMAESKTPQKFGDENRSSLKPVTPKIISGGGKKGTGKTGTTYTTGGSAPKPITSTTTPTVKPITSTTTEIPKSTPTVPTKGGTNEVSTTSSGSVSSTSVPVKIATSNLFILNEPELEIESMADLIIEDIGGIELLGLSRNDLIAEQEINYQPIKNIADTSVQYNPLTILAVQDIDQDYFNKFPIILEKYIPRIGSGSGGAYVYINSNNSIVVEAANLLPGQFIEIQFLSFGSSVSDTIYT